MIENFIKSQSELLNSRPIDMYKACYNSKTAVLTDLIYKTYLEPLKKYKRSIAKKHLNKILLDLYHSWYFDPSLCLAVSFNNNDYTLPARYNTIKITKTTISIIKELIVANLLHHKPGMPAKNQYWLGPSYTSRVWPTTQLIKYFLGLRLNIINILAHDIDKETIILNKKIVALKDGAKQKRITKYQNVSVNYSDTPKIRANRLILACYNLLIRKTHIDIGDAEDYFVSSGDQWGTQKKCFITPNCFIYRVFINNTFNNGGRVYGGWWQKCHPTYRKDILINGNPVVEVGFIAIFLEILYEIEKITLPNVTESENMYNVLIPEIDDIPEENFINYSRTDLHLFKKFLLKTLTNNAIRAESKKELFRSTIKAITAEEHTKNSQIFRPPPSILKTISHKFLASVFESIKQKHHLIADYFLSGIGSKLQLIESNITMNLIEHFTALKVPILTLHDSYIIEAKWGQTLINAMKCSWREEISNLKTNKLALPKRSNHLERITSHENHYNTKHLFAEPIKINKSSISAVQAESKLKRLRAIFNSSSDNQQKNKLSIEEFFEIERFHRIKDIIEIRSAPSPKTTTKRYKISLKRHQEWLSEGDTENSSQETTDRYKNFYAGINSTLYAKWLRYKPLWMLKNKPNKPGLNKS